MFTGHIPVMDQAETRATSSSQAIEHHADIASLGGYVGVGWALWMHITSRNFLTEIPELTFYTDS